MSNVPALREAAIAAWQAVDDYHSTNTKDGDLSAEGLTEIGRLSAEAQKADQTYADAAKAAGEAKSARERLDMYHTAVKGTAVNWQQVATAVPGRKASIGQAFIDSPEFKAFQASGMGKSDRTRFGTAARFETNRIGAVVSGSDIIHTEPDDGALPGPAGPLVTPTYVPDVLPLAARPLRIRQLLTNDTAPDAPIIDARQTSRSGAAAGVGQSTEPLGSGAVGGLKPQFSTTWERFETTPKTIAGYAVTTRQAINQSNRLRTLIDQEGTLQLDLEEEREIVSGHGGEELDGIITQTGVQTLDAAVVNRLFPNLAAIRIAKTMILTGIARLYADGVVVHPEDGQEFDLLHDTLGRYMAGNPFGGDTGENTPIWRLPRVESEAIAVGTALVGNFRLGATFYDVQPMVVYMSDSHEDFFVRNLIAVLFEERVALIVRRPSAFCLITLTDWAEGS